MERVSSGTVYQSKLVDRCEQWVKGQGVWLAVSFTGSELGWADYGTSKICWECYLQVICMPCAMSCKGNHLSHIVLSTCKRTETSTYTCTHRHLHMYRCLLSKKAKPVMNIIQEVLSSILCFSFQSSLIRSSPQRSYRSMAETHKKFSEATAILIKGIV